MAKLNVLFLFVLIAVHSLTSLEIGKIDSEKIADLLGSSKTDTTESGYHRVKNFEDSTKFDTLQQTDFFEASDYDEYTSLNISAKGLNKLEPKYFEDASNVKVLIASNNNLTGIGQNLFIDAPLVEWVDFSNNSIERIESAAFKGAKHIKILNLSRNKIGKLSGLPLDRLVILDLSRNQLTTLNEYVLENLINLRYLNLSGNFIRELPPATFSHQKKLISLDLAKNNLITFDFTVFASHEIHSFDDFQTDFSLLNGPYSTDDLHSIDLSKNQLVELKNFRDENFAQLDVLNINDNRFNCSYLQRFVDSIRWAIDLRANENWHTVATGNSVYGIHCISTTEMRSSRFVSIDNMLTIKLLLAFVCIFAIAILLMILFLGRKQLFTCGKRNSNGKNGKKMFSESNQNVTDESASNEPSTAD